MKALVSTTDSSPPTSPRPDSAPRRASRPSPWLIGLSSWPTSASSPFSTTPVVARWPPGSPTRRCTAHRRPVAPLFHHDWIPTLELGTAHRRDRAGHHLRGDVAALSQAPGAAHGHRHHRHRVDGPHHELGTVRGLQPPADPLPGDMAAGLALADGRTVHRSGLRHLLPGGLLPRHLDPAANPGPPPGRHLRLAPSSDQPGRC